MGFVVTITCGLDIKSRKPGAEWWRLEKPRTEPLKMVDIGPDFS
jgi:hypothetical protein